jgi:predicted ATPase
MLRQYFGIKPGDPREAAIEKIARALQAFDGGLDHLLPYLCHLLGVPGDDLPELAADELKQATFEAVAQLVLAESRRTPVVMVVEDLHWVDEASREMLAMAASHLTTSRVMKIVSHRPDFQPDWNVKAAFTRLNLGRLSDDEATEMIRAIACAGLPEALERRIRAKAEGNPLFVEELTRGLFEEGSLVCEDGGVRVTRPVEEIRIPDTVQELLAARLDRLGPGSKRVVQIASALGRQFGRGQVETLLQGEGIDVAAELDAIERAGSSIARTPLSATSTAARACREVAYERSRAPPADERIGALLEAEAGDGSPEHAALIARHYARSENRRKAIAALVRAALEAERIPSYAAAVRLFGEAWEITESVLDDPAHAGEEFRRLALEAALGLSRVSFLYSTADSESARRAAEWGLRTARALGDDESYAILLPTG